MKDNGRINQRAFMCNPWTWTVIWGLTLGEGRAEWRWGKGEKVGTIRAYIIKINIFKKQTDKRNSNPLLEFKMWA